MKHDRRKNSFVNICGLSYFPHIFKTKPIHYQIRIRCGFSVAAAHFLSKMILNKSSVFVVAVAVAVVATWIPHFLFVDLFLKFFLTCEATYNAYKCREYSEFFLITTKYFEHKIGCSLLLLNVCHCQLRWYFDIECCFPIAKWLIKAVQFTMVSI